MGLTGVEGGHTRGQGQKMWMGWRVEVEYELEEKETLLRNQWLPEQYMSTYVLHFQLVCLLTEQTVEPSGVNKAVLSWCTVIDRNVVSRTVYCLCSFVHNDA